MKHSFWSSPSFFSAFAAVAGGFVLLTSGCTAPKLGVRSGLETDEAYLRRDESFVTDAEYLAFAMEQAGVEDAGDDYFDANRAAASNRSGREFTPYSNSLLGIAPGYGSYGNGWASPYGGYGYSPYGYPSYGYTPYSGWGSNPYCMNCWSGYGYGYSPYGYNPYGYNPYGSSWGGGGWAGNAGGWTDNSGFNVTSGPRIPLISSTGTNSNLGETGLLLQPRNLEVGPNLVTSEVMDQALGRHVEIEVASPPPPTASRANSNPWERVLASPSIPDEIREPYSIPAGDPVYRTPEPTETTPSVSPSRPSSTPSRPATTSPSRPSTPSSRPAVTSPSRTPSGGGSAPSRSGRGG